MILSKSIQLRWIRSNWLCSLPSFFLFLLNIFPCTLWLDSDEIIFFAAYFLSLVSHKNSNFSNICCSPHFHQLFIIGYPFSLQTYLASNKFQHTSISNWSSQFLITFVEIDALFTLNEQTKERKNERKKPLKQNRCRLTIIKFMVDL